jgi:NAD+ diphosphatase
MKPARFIPTLGTSLALDRQGMKRSDEAYLSALMAHPDTRFMVLADQKPVIRSNAARTETSIRWLTRAELERGGMPISDALFLGVTRDTGSDTGSGTGKGQGGAGRFAISVTEHRTAHAPGAIELFRPIVDLRALAMQGVMSAEDLSLISQAKALSHWHEGHRCCGHCGGTTLVKDGGWKRKCWACGQEHFPRTDPVVIMLVVAGDQCLLGHEARFSKEPKMYSTLAGFIEPGEDPEHAVRREVFEEAGLEIGKVTYHSAQPWAFPHSLMIGCIGHATTTAIKIDPTEIEEARWFSRDEIGLMLDGTHPQKWWVPGKQAIARALIKSFYDGDL